MSLPQVKPKPVSANPLDGTMEDADVMNENQHDTSPSRGPRGGRDHERSHTALGPPLPFRDDGAPGFTRHSSAPWRLAHCRVPAHALHLGVRGCVVLRQCASSIRTRPQDSAACRIRVLVGRSIPGSCQLQHDGHVSNRHAWSMGGDHPCGILARQSLEPGSIASRSVPPNMAVQPTACGGGCMPIR